MRNKKKLSRDKVIELIENEKRWFDSNRKDLYKKYRGMYVAVFGCCIVDADKDVSKLLERFYSTHNNEIAYFGFVGDSPSVGCSVLACEDDKLKKEEAEMWIKELENLTETGWMAEWSRHLTHKQGNGGSNPSPAISSFRYEQPPQGDDDMDGLMRPPEGNSGEIIG